MASDIDFDYVSAEEIPAASEIEQEGYPADEAATADTFRLRQSQAGELFIGAYETSETGSRRLIGYVCSTLSPAKTLTHESMSTHVPNTPTVCIHSVCVAKSHRRKGVGIALLREYVKRLETAVASGAAKYDRILLLTHEELRFFYESAGFEWEGLSDVVHGSRAWFEMQRNLNSHPTETLEHTQPEHDSIPANVLEALHKPKDKVPTGRLISEFHHALSDLLDQSDTHPGILLNKFDLLCSRAGCGSIILKKGVARWVERSSVQLDSEGWAEHPMFPALPTPPETAQWWLISPSPLLFENIGTSRPLQTVTESGRRLKLLSCAECDLGPIGWCEEGGSEFWLSCSRVAYRG